MSDQSRPTTDYYNAGMGTTPGMWEAVSAELEDAQIPASASSALRALILGDASVTPSGRITSTRLIDSRTEQGKLLLMALSKITTESQTTSTPDEVLGQLNKLRDSVFTV